MTRPVSARPHARGDGSRPGDRYIPWLFVAFFAVVLAANGALIAIALGSFTGLTTEHAYDKGLAYNRTLGDGAALTGAQIKARFIRPTSAGADMEAELVETAAGHYEAEPALPLAGQWDMVVIASHDGASYQTTRRIFVPD